MRSIIVINCEQLAHELPFRNPEIPSRKPENIKEVKLVKIVIDYLHWASDKTGSVRVALGRFSHVLQTQDQILRAIENRLEIPS